MSTEYDESLPPAPTVVRNMAEEIQAKEDARQEEQAEKEKAFLADLKKAASDRATREKEIEQLVARKKVAEAKLALAVEARLQTQKSAKAALEVLATHWYLGGVSAASRWGFKIQMTVLGNTTLMHESNLLAVRTRDSSHTPIFIVNKHSQWVNEILAVLAKHGAPHLLVDSPTAQALVTSM